MRSNTLVLHSGSRHRIQRQLASLFASIEERVESLKLVGSGYSLQYISAISANIARRDYAGSALYGEMFVSHLTARQKSAIVDIAAAERDGCLYSAVAQGFLAPCLTGSYFPAGSVEEDQTKFFTQRYMYTGSLQRPVKLSQINKFEKMNRHGLNFAVNVFMKGTYSQHGTFAGGAHVAARVEQEQHGGETGFFFPICLSDRQFTCGKVVNLLLLKTGVFLCHCDQPVQPVDVLTSVVDGDVCQVRLPCCNKVTLRHYGRQ
jgi:hypothetical protein